VILTRPEQAKPFRFQLSLPFSKPNQTKKEEIMTMQIQTITETVATAIAPGVETLLDILLRIATNHNETMISDDDEANADRQIN
jgi:hypothetical protein